MKAWKKTIVILFAKAYNDAKEYVFVLYLEGKRMDTLDELYFTMLKSASPSTRKRASAVRHVSMRVKWKA